MRRNDPKPWRWWHTLGAIFLFGLAATDDVFAEPATIRVTPTTLLDDGSGGPADKFRLHRGCNLGAQTVGAVVADPARVGETYSFIGDTTEQYVLCAVAVNAGGVGGFENVVTLTFDQPIPPPGKSRITFDCEVDVTSGEIYNCEQIPNP